MRIFELFHKGAVIGKLEFDPEISILVIRSQDASLVVKLKNLLAHTRFVNDRKRDIKQSEQDNGKWTLSDIDTLQLTDALQSLHQSYAISAKEHSSA